ncbi:hypothetical protein [Ancylobacter sp. TS-1]|uniref:hypothetical protein n=1 Tax=Ancylobacter sp. TS-1 TaxID=1850374 RepID=UPI001265C072|nr:hypothetical protein [Ancylobacter sp. TS-1]QFR32404.1 hypothetical protein GBB76_04330 [Ancylobacter sp. TS-1]
MKELTLDDLSREELLTFLKRSVLPRWLIGRLVQQADLLSIRHETLQTIANAAAERRRTAWAAREAAWDDQHRAKYGTRQKVAADLAFIKAESAYKRAAKIEERASADVEACWAALEAEWERGR